MARKTSGKPAKKQKGSGGKIRGSLEGRGPTPPAHMRHWYKERVRAAERQRKAAAAAQAPALARTPSRPFLEEGAEIIAGRNPVVEALRADIPARVLYVAYRIDTDDRVREAIKIAADRDIPMVEVSRDRLDQLTGGAVHQGIGLEIPPYEYAHPDDLVEAAHQAGEMPLIVALDGVTDPRNLGAIARSAAAFGAHGIVVPSRRSVGVTSGAWKTSAGTLATLPVARASNLTQTLKAYRKEGLFVVGLDGDAKEEIADNTLLTEPLVLVVGSEGKGLSRLVRETCDMLARIPMGERVESLNAGVAAGIALYEIARRRRQAVTQ